MTDYALQFDGNQNYLDLGLMGSFGSNLGSGFYASFQIRTSESGANKFIFGTQDNDNGQTLSLILNQGAISGRLLFQLIDTSSPSLKVLKGFCDTTLNNGSNHTVVLTVIPASNTITITIDGAPQSITYITQNTPNTFVNFSFKFFVAANNNGGSVGSYASAILDNLRLGINAFTLYGSYNLNEGTGITASDASGNGNTATLKGSPVPTWIESVFPTNTRSLVTPKTAVSPRGGVVPRGAVGSRVLV